MSRAHLVKRRDSRDATGRPPAVPAKAKVAIAVLLTQPASDLEKAAAAAGLTLRRLKSYLKAPHVRRYFMTERQAALDAICAGNPAALKAIRDDGSNKMAAVAAVRGLEMMREQEETHRPGAQVAPGLVVIIESRTGAPDQVIAPPAPVIDGTADEFEFSNGNRTNGGER